MGNLLVPFQEGKGVTFFSDLPFTSLAGIAECEIELFTSILIFVTVAVLFEEVENGSYAFCRFARFLFRSY